MRTRSNVLFQKARTRTKYSRRKAQREAGGSLADKKKEEQQKQASKETITGREQSEKQAKAQRQNNTGIVNANSIVLQTETWIKSSKRASISS